MKKNAAIEDELNTFYTLHFNDISVYLLYIVNNLCKNTVKYISSVSSIAKVFISAYAMFDSSISLRVLIAEIVRVISLRRCLCLIDFITIYLVFLHPIVIMVAFVSVFGRTVLSTAA